MVVVILNQKLNHRYVEKEGTKSTCTCNTITSGCYFLTALLARKGTRCTLTGTFNRFRYFEPKIIP